MKRFEFRLAQVQRYRRQQLELEEAKLQILQAERQALDAEAARLTNETQETRKFLMVTGPTDAQQLAASESYLRHLAKVQQRHAAKVAEWQKRAEQQRQAIMEARRRVRLLDRLELKQRREWQAQVDREQEELAAELYLARQQRS